MTQHLSLGAIGHNLLRSIRCHPNISVQVADAELYRIRKRSSGNGEGPEGR